MARTNPLWENLENFELFQIDGEQIKTPAAVMADVSRGASQEAIEASLLFNKVMEIVKNEPLHSACYSRRIKTLLQQIISIDPQHLQAHELIIYFSQLALTELHHSQECKTLLAASRNLQRLINRFREDAKRKCFDTEQVSAQVSHRFGAKEKTLLQQKQQVQKQLTDLTKTAIFSAKALIKHYPAIGHYRLAMIYKLTRQSPFRDDLTDSRCLKYLAKHLHEAQESLDYDDCLPTLTNDDHGVALLSWCEDGGSYPCTSRIDFQKRLEIELEIVQDSVSEQVSISALLGKNKAEPIEDFSKELTKLLSIVCETSVNGDLPATQVIELRSSLLKTIDKINRKN